MYLPKMVRIFWNIFNCKIFEHQELKRKRSLRRKQKRFGKKKWKKTFHTLFYSGGKFGVRAIKNYEKLHFSPFSLSFFSSPHPPAPFLYSFLISFNFVYFPFFTESILCVYRVFVWVPHRILFKFKAAGSRQGFEYNALNTRLAVVEHKISSVVIYPFAMRCVDHFGFIERAQNFKQWTFPSI